jgi:hypothetical protein
LHARGHSFDNGRRDIRLEFPCREVVEKEQRAGALNKDVVDAVIHQVRTDRVVDPGFERELEFGSDSIRRGDENRITHVRKRAGEHPAEASDLRQRSLVECASRELADLSRRRGLHYRSTLPRRRMKWIET